MSGSIGWPSGHDDNPPTKRQLEILGAWRRSRTYRGAAKELKLSESTVKNTMGVLRQRARTNNAELVKRYWRLLAMMDDDPMMTYRRMRYEIDNDYRERQRKVSRERMRKIRAVHGNQRESIYQELYEKQKGLCAICHKSESAFGHKSGNVRRLAIDHDHETGKVRALLCRNCNMMLGTANDDPKRLQDGIDYLVGHAQVASHNDDEAA